MEGFPYTLAILGFAAKALVLAAIPTIALMIGWRAVVAVDHGRGLAGRAVLLLGGGAGVGLAIFVLAHGRPPMVWRLHEVLRRDGPWALDFGAFLDERVNPFLRLLDPLAVHLATAPFTEAALLIPMITGGLAMALVWRATLAGDGPLAYLGVFAFMVWTAYAALFLICLLFWMVHLLNFWTFAVLGLGLHLLRHL